MKKSLFSSFLALAMLALLTGCGGGGGGNSGGGGGGTGSPTAASLLNGQYAFTFSGNNEAGPISIVGSFAADGKGNITGGVEDVTLVKKSSNTIGAQAAQNFSGTYTVGSDGRGTMTFNTSSDGAQDFAMVIESNNQGQLIWFDNSATGSGNFSLQDTTAFTASTLNGSFAYGLNGVDPAQTAYSRVGVFTAASGSVSTGESDLNNSFGTGGLNSAQTISGGSIGAPNSSTGRGTLSLTYASLTVKYIYYVVSKTTLNLIEADDNASVYGTATAQTGGPFTAASLNGNYVFSTGGENTGGAIAEAGQFNADGVGTLSGVGDENFGGTSTQNYTLGGNICVGDGQRTWNDGAGSSRIRRREWPLRFLYRIEQHHLPDGSRRRRNHQWASHGANRRTVHHRIAFVRRLRITVLGHRLEPVRSRFLGTGDLEWIGHPEWRHAGYQR